MRSLDFCHSCLLSDVSPANSRHYHPLLRYVMATYHPPGLPNEMPGKASNTRWAAQRLWAFMEKEGLPEERVILTVADADSDFHAVRKLRFPHGVVGVMVRSFCMRHLILGHKNLLFLSLLCFDHSSS